jgi:hypothetical protein
MANKFARSNGDFNGPIWALTSNGVAGSTTAPTVGDNAIANTFTIQITGNVACDNITNSTLYGGTVGGTFNLGNNSIATATIPAAAITSTDVVVLTGTNSARFVGTVNGGTSTANNQAIENSGSGTLTIVGSLIGQTSSGAGPSVVANSSTGIVNFTGTITGGSGTNTRGLDNSSGGAIIVTGNVTGGTGSAGYGINNSSTGTAIVIGNVTATSATNAFVSLNASAINKISGNIINHPNGTAAIYAARYVVDPVPQNSLIQYSNVNQFSTDSLSAFSMPPVSAVRFGTSFANGTLTGTCKVPSVNSVNIGVPVDNTVGTAFLIPAELFDTSVASLTSSNTLGSRLKNSATVQSVGNIIASFSN